MRKTEDADTTSTTNGTETLTTAPSRIFLPRHPALSTQHPAQAAAERGSAMLLALILLTVLLLTGSALVLTARASATAARQQAQRAETDRAVAVALRLLTRDLKTMLESDAIRDSLRSTFDLTPEAAERQVQETLTRAGPNLSRREGPLLLEGRARWTLARGLSIDPRVYNALYTMDATAAAATAAGAGGSASSSLELKGSVLISIGHLPLCHYQAILPPAIMFDQDTYKGPVRIEGEARFSSPILFFRDLETTAASIGGLAQCVTRARVVTGAPPIDPDDRLLDRPLQDLSWEEIRVRLMLEPGPSPPPAGIYSDGARAVLVEGDVEEMTLAANGDEQLVSVRHATLGKLVFRMRPEFTVVRMPDGGEMTAIGMKDRLIVHGRIGALGGGLWNDASEIEQAPNVFDLNSPSVVRSLTIAASSAIEISNHLVVPRTTAGNRPMIGILSQRIAGDGVPGIMFASPGRELAVAAHLYVSGGDVSAQCARAAVESMQVFGGSIDPAAHIVVGYRPEAEGGGTLPPGYPVTGDPLVYIGRPVVSSLRAVEQTN